MTEAGHGRRITPYMCCPQAPASYYRPGLCALNLSSASLFRFFKVSADLRVCVCVCVCVCVYVYVCVCVRA